MSFDIGLLGGTDQSLVDSTAPMYPVIQWVNGKAPNKSVGGVLYKGGWFMSGENAPFKDGDILGNWAEMELVHRDGSSTQGYGVEGIKIAILGMRQRWEVYEENGNRRVFPWSQYDQAKAIGWPRGRLHMLAMVSGLEEHGPFLITMSGKTAQKMTDRGGVLQSFDATVIYEANMQLHRHAMENGSEPQRAPRFIFWLPVCSERKSGKPTEPVFTTVGKAPNTSQVTYPALFGVPEDHVDVDLSSYFVGPENKEDFQSKAIEAKPWVEEWNSLEPGSTAAEADGYSKETPKTGDTGNDDIDFAGTPQGGGPAAEDAPPLEEIPF